MIESDLVSQSHTDSQQQDISGRVPYTRIFCPGIDRELLAMIECGESPEGDASQLAGLAPRIIPHGTTPMFTYEII
ncbi:hypothetical protein GCM10028812_33710 [Ancylobacter sonchi]